MIPIHNIVKREQALNSSTRSNDINIDGLKRGLETHYNFQSINTLGENMITDSNLDQSFDYMLDRLEEVCEKDSEGNGIRLTNTLCESVFKIRQANQIGNLLKRRIATTKSKIISKINKNISNVKQAVGMKPHTKNNLPSPDSQYSKDFRKGQRDDRKKHREHRTDRDSFKLECLENLDEHVTMIKNCDRVINTHELINKRFDTKKVFSDIYSDIDLCVKEFCMLLDTYDVPFKAKVNICLENIAYEYDKNNKSIDKSQLAEAVAEYFMINASEQSDWLDKEVLNEEKDYEALKAKIERDNEKLKRYEKDERVGGIVGRVVVAVGRLLVKGVRLTANVVLGTIAVLIAALFALITLGFLINIIVNVILLICSIFIGLIALSVPLGILVLINPDDKAKLRDAAKKVKDKKVKAALNRVCNAMDTKDSIKEEYIANEYAICLEEMRQVLENNRFYKPSDVSKALMLFEEVERPTLNITMEDAILGLTEANSKSLSVKSKAAKVLSDIRLMAHKTPGNLVNKFKELYADSPKNIVDEMPNVFRILFDIIVIAGSFAISVPLGVIVAMVTWYIGLGIDREMAVKYTAEYKKERERAVRKGKKMKDKKMKERNEAYIQELDRAIEKLEDYERGLKAESEEMGVEDEMSDNSVETEEEAAVQIMLIDKAVSVLEGFNRKQFYRSLREDNYDKELFSYMVMECVGSGLISKVEMERNLSSMQYNSNKTSIIRDQINLLESYETKPSNDLFKRAVAALDAQDIIQEMSFTNTLVMIKDKVKKSAQNLSDKEKIASRTLDSSIESLKNSMENSLKQENREAVIRGQILPSASRIIKLALITGFAFLLHPALGIIYLLGTFAMSKKLRIKERQLVLDELDTELKVCAEYIEKAKNNQDMNAYRQCLNIEKKLLRQRDRLKYKMTAEWNEKTPERYSDKDYNK